MILRTAKHTFSASTFSALAAAQEDLLRANPTIEIKIEVGPHSVNVENCEDGPDGGFDMARTVLEDLNNVIEALRDAAAAAGDDKQVEICEEALDGGMQALEMCCEAIEAAHAANCDD